MSLLSIRQCRGERPGRKPRPGGQYAVGRDAGGLSATGAALSLVAPCFFFAASNNAIVAQLLAAAEIHWS